jgi:hypothetical protein
MHDQRVCPICLLLEGKQWTFEVGRDSFPTELTYGELGVVWNVQSGSEAHGQHNNTCRCSVESQFDFSDLIQRITHFADELERVVRTQ